MSITFFAGTGFGAMPGAPQINVGNRNACDLLSLLGLLPADETDDDLAGNVTAEDFLGRVLVAIALAETTVDPAGRPDMASGRVIDLGYGAHYLPHRLIELRQLAEWARARSLRVWWS